MFLNNIKLNNTKIYRSLPPPASWQLVANTGSSNETPRYVYPNGIQYLPSSGYVFGTYYTAPNRVYYGNLDNLQYNTTSDYHSTNKVVFKNWIYSGINDSNYIVRTQNGIDYDTVYSGGSIRGFMSNNTYIIAVGANGNIQRSTDGVNFSTIISGVTHALLTVFEVDNKIIIGTNNYSILVSTDNGLTFSEEQSINPRFLSVNGGSSLTSHLHANLLGPSNPPHVYRTTDGISYSNINIPHSAVASVSSIVYNDNKYIATTYVNATTAPKMFESIDDGLTFQEITIPDQNIVGQLLLSSANNVLFASSQLNGDVWAYF